MLKQSCFVLLTLCVFVICFNNLQDDLSKRALHSLGRVLNFIYENIDDMNIDGLFGVVFAEANLQSLLEHTNFSNKDLIRRQKIMTSEILHTANLDRLSLNSEGKIFTQYMLNPNLWKRSINFTNGELSKNTEPYLKDVYGETCNGYLDNIKENNQFRTISDECLFQLINNSKVKPCQVSIFCNEYLINDSSYGSAYELTHRMLFLQVAEALQCKWNRQWIDKKIKIFCSRIYSEALTISKCSFPKMLDDLFMEQVFLCGYEGFEEFLKKEWIEHILSIQTQEGCFTTLLEKNYSEKELKRRKRDTNVIKYGCLDHTTGLGAAVLSLFLRFLESRQL